MRSSKSSKSSVRGRKSKLALVAGKLPITRRLALLVVAVSVIGGYALLTQTFAASSGTPEVASGYAGKCLDDYRNNAASGAYADLWSCNGTAAQQWTYDANSQQVMIHGKCMDIQGAKYDNGRIIDLYKCNGQANQKWKLMGNTIVNPHSNRCLNAPMNQNGQQLQIWNCDGRTSEIWQFTHYVVASTGGSGSGSGGGGVSVGSPEVASGYADSCMDDYRNNAANGAIVDIFTCNGTAAQQWTRSGAQGKQQIMVHGKCLDVYRNGTSDGYVVELFTCNGGANQEWNVVNGTIVGVQSGKCLNAPDPRNGTQLQIWKCDGRNSERWAFSTYHPNTAVSSSTSSSSGSSGATTSTGEPAVSGTSPAVITTPEIQSEISGKCVDDFKNSSANLAVVDLYTCNGTAAQQWTKSGSAGAQEIMIHGKCLDVYHQGRSAGTIVELYTCNGGKNQQWNISGTQIKGVQSGMCLNAPDTRNGVQLQVWNCDLRNSEKWFFSHHSVVPADQVGAGSSSSSSGSSSSSSSGSATNEFPGVPQTPCDPTSDPFCPGFDTGTLSD